MADSRGRRQGPGAPSRAKTAPFSRRRVRWRPFAPLALILAALPLPIVAEPLIAPTDTALPPPLLFPLDCSLGESCFLQNLVDREPGPGIRDAACGIASYDGHRGTDLRIGDPALFRSGVMVRAAAPGTVVALRNDAPERLRAPGTPWPEGGGQCGNGVAIRTESGWVMRYCHMRRGSVRVRRGQRLAAGTPLGIVGLSGDTTFPHLHFDIRRKGRVLDPFDIRPVPCPAAPHRQLWRHPLPLATSRLIHAALFDRLPDRATLVLTPPSRLAADPPRLVGGILAINLAPGDRIDLRLEGPDGAILAKEVRRLRQRRAELRLALGVQRPAAGWQAGDYRIIAELRRDGRLLDRISRMTALGGAPRE